MSETQGFDFIKASEPGTTGLTSSEIIGLLEDRRPTSWVTSSSLTCCLTLRVLILQCCWRRLSSTSTLSRNVLLCEFDGKLLNIAQRKVGLLTAAWLPSDKTPAPATYTPFLCPRPITPLPNLSPQQPQNPLRWSCAPSPRPITKRLRRLTYLPFSNLLPVLIPEGLGYQDKNPRTTHHSREEMVVAS